MKRKYMVVYERNAEDNWGGWCPDIGGAVGAGDSISDARASLLAGMEIMLDDLASRGTEAPPATSMSVDFSEFAEPATSHFEIEWLSVELPDSNTRNNTLARQAA